MRSLVEVASKIMSSVEVGIVSVDQFSGVEQLLSAPPPSQVRVADSALWAMLNKTTTTTKTHQILFLR